MMLRKLIANKVLRKWNRRLAWVLAVLLLLQFISGYTMLGKLHLMSIATARKIHKTLLPLTIVLFILHTLYSSGLLIYQRRVRKLAKKKSG